METLRQWIREKKDKNIRTEKWSDDYIIACDDLLSDLPSLTATLEAEILKLIKKLPDTYEGNESAVFRTTKKEIEDIITTYFKRDTEQSKSECKSQSKSNVDLRCTKCGNPFEPHHLSFHVNGKTYHTGCVPK